MGLPSAEAIPRVQVFRASWKSWSRREDPAIVLIPLQKPARPQRCPGPHCASPSTQLAQVRIPWPSVSKGHRNFVSHWHEGSAQTPPLLTALSVCMAPGEDGGRAVSSVSGELAGWLPPAAPSHLYSVWNERTWVISPANHPWGVRPPPTTGEAFNEDWPNSGKNRSQLVCD